jgi:hypothetical protein
MLSSVSQWSVVKVFIERIYDVIMIVICTALLVYVA